jgi:hypothetical protein
MVYPLFGFKGEFITTLLTDIRIRVFEEAMKHNVNLIFTACFENPEHISFIQQLEKKAQEYGATVMFIRLSCDFEEECKRVESPSRKSNPTKLHTSELLKWALSERNITSRMDFIENQFELDTTHLSAEVVAERIRTYYNLVKQESSKDDFSYE